MMTKWSLSWGLMPRASSSKKLIYTHFVPMIFTRKPEDMTFSITTYFTYLLREALERPLPEIPPTMVLASWCRTPLVISRRRRMIGLEWRRWSMLVLPPHPPPPPHSKRHYICQKVQGVCIPPTWAGRLRGLNMYITCLGSEGLLTTARSHMR